MRVLLTGGGTGGHIYPALAIARGLQVKEPGVEVLYVGTRRGLEADIVPKQGVPFRTVTVEGWGRKISVQAVKAGLKLCKGCVESWRLLREYRPQVVVGTGGFVCGPVVLAAAMMGIPTVIHEQNALPGITNRMLARFVDAICLTFPESAGYFPGSASIYRTGLPVRPEILSADRREAAEKLGLDADRTTILVTGGSRGAQSINRVVVRLAKEIQSLPNLQLLHVTGSAGYQETINRFQVAGIDSAGRGNITIMPYIYHMEHALAVSDLVVSRAGATFLSEILARGIPAILIPYPHAAENHQEYNARSLEKEGAAVVIVERELTGESLSSVVLDLLRNPAKREAMGAKARNLGRPNALQEILGVIEEVTQ
ncbi:UDP-diphospho-muramoylpentapeptide beta-N-acetylglucosaminyltransferase [Clostridiales bacterium PH28_bin88]|nr:UDP-diphospho-muramoylpentapeptide beta-N-acetylglucosaminyltransferase [Clostridiales bacterium PH28_bin88]